MAGWLGTVEQRANKLLESLDERANERKNDGRANAAGATSLLGGELIRGRKQGATAPDSSSNSTVGAPDHQHSPSREASKASVPQSSWVPPPPEPEDASMRRQLASLAHDLEVVLQHGKAMHKRLQGEGQCRQASHLRVRELDRALEAVAAEHLQREAELRAQIRELEERAATIREQTDRRNDEQREHDEEVRLLEARVAEQVALVAAANGEVERLHMAMQAQATSIEALRGDMESHQTEVSALQAARLDRERHFVSRESALEARAAELTEALSASAARLQAKSDQLDVLSAEVDKISADCAHNIQARQRAEAEVAACNEKFARLEEAMRSAPQLVDATVLSVEIGCLECEVDRMGTYTATAAERPEVGRSSPLHGQPSPGTVITQALRAARNSAAEPARAADAALQAQVDQLTARLTSQQNAMQELGNDRTALKLELEAETKRRRRAEQILSSPRQRQTPDIESGNSDGQARSLSSSNMELKRRWAHRPNVAKVMEVVDEAAKLIDKGSLQTTRFLIHNPYVRLAVACYVILLHLWVMVVLMHVAPGNRLRRQRH